MSDASRAVEENQIAILMEMGRLGGGEVRDDASVAWVIGGSPIAYHNCVVRAELTPETADDIIVASRELMRAKGVPGSWHVGPSARPTDLPERLERHGFEGGPEPGMTRRLDTLVPEAPTGFTVQEDDDLDAFASVLGQGFGEGETEARWVREIYGKVRGDERWHHFIARIDGEPVGTATLFVHPRDVGGIYFVCASPGHRRKGIGAAVTIAAMNSAMDLGCRLAALGSSPMGHGLYLKLGFETVCDVGVYEWSP